MPPTPTDEAMEAIKHSISLVRALNKREPSRAKALALTRCEEAIHWLWADAVSTPSIPKANEENARVTR